MAYRTRIWLVLYRQGAKICYLISILIQLPGDLFLASGSEPAYSMLMSGFAGHIYIWLAIARQEKIATLLCVKGYNPCW